MGVACGVGKGVVVGTGVGVVGGTAVGVGVAVGASCPPDWVQATKAIRRAAEMEDAVVSFKP